MHVLIHAVSAHEMGGAARHLTGFLPALHRAGGNHRFLLYVNEKFSLGVLPPNFEVRRLPVQSAWQRLYWDQVSLPRIAKRNQVDVVLALLSFGSALPSRPQIAFLRNPIHCPYITLDLDLKSRLDVWIRRYFLYLTLRAASLVVAPSAAIRDTVRCAHKDLPLNRFHILPHAFDQAWCRAAVEVPERISVLLPEQRTDDTVRFLYVGHLLPYKGFDTVLGALRLLAERGNRFRLYLTIARENWPAGFDRLQAEVSRLKLGNRVTILGRVADSVVAGLYRRCDILWFPSLCETFGWPIIEAMSSGVPILASDTPLNREMVRDAGLYYPPFDADAAAGAASRLIVDPSLRLALGEIGRGQAEAHIGWDEYASTVLRHCGEAAAPVEPARSV